MHRFALVVACLLLSSQAHAQVESVTVTAAREAAISKFIETRAATTRMTGKLARWKVPVCPVVYGIPANYAGFIAQHIRDVAAQVGAPVDADKNCRGNIQIVFTTAPQALLDNIRLKNSNFLGYHDNGRQAEAMTQLRRPVHAFHATATTDLRGNVQTDTRKTTGITIELPGLPPPTTGGQIGALPTTNQMITMTLPGASAMSVSGTRFLGDGLSSEFQHVVMVVDTLKVATLEMGSLSDNLAMLALSQPSEADTCQDLPSISNLMITPACGPATLTAEMSVYDRAYLRGLYRSQIEGAGNVQKAQISYEMRQAQQGD